MNALDVEVLSEERLKILGTLESWPQLWHLPALTKRFVSDPDQQCRVAAGRIITKMLGDTTMYYNRSIRLETRDAALKETRRIVQSEQEPFDVRKTAYGMLVAWNAFYDRPLLERLKF